MAEVDSMVSDKAEEGESDQTGGANMVIAYFFRAGENDNVGTIEKGNHTMYLQNV